MGLLGSSFKRELGKNSAKVVSNLLFGDKFATPYRIIRKQQDQRKKERESAREYKISLIEARRSEREYKKTLKELDQIIAQKEKDELIQKNNKIVNDHNNYFGVIQSVHKDYSEPVNWDTIIKNEPPKEIRPSSEFHQYYKDFTNNQINSGISELKKTAKLSFFSHILKGLYSPKLKWLFKFIGNKKFFYVSLFAFLITLMYFIDTTHRLKHHSDLDQSSSFYLIIFLLILFGILFIFSALSKIIVSDIEMKIVLDKAIADLESKRETWYNDYLNEHEQAYQKYLKDVQHHRQIIEVASKIKSGDKSSFISAIQLLNPFEDIELYGSKIKAALINDHVTIDLFVRDNEVIPNCTKRLLRNGLEVKDDPLPQSRFNEIYQDYVCSCILRIAKEVFSIVPISKVLINAKGNILNSATGQHDEQIIVSVLIEKSILERLNFDLIDPSDSMSNFNPNMNFNKANGFYPVSSLIITNPDMPIQLSSLIESDLTNIWGNPKYQSLCKYNYYFPSTVENNAILFIGLNPSFSEEQLQSNSYKLTQRNNKNQYFKKFEDISEFCDTKWTHLDLLFFRETHQTSIDDMLRLPNNIGVGFIWEQLQISKRIIEACHPKVMVVCNAQAATFLGKNKQGNQNVWLDFRFIPDENSGTFVWNNIPVFFSRPLSGLGTIDNSSYDQLRLQIKKALMN